MLKRNYYVTILSIVPTFIFPIHFSKAQNFIKADTIAVDCRAYKVSGYKFIITTQKEYEDSQFFTEEFAGCLPFEDIDFDREIVVGYKYQGSNCDRRIEESMLLHTGNNYLIQFSTWPPQICRDLNHRIAWFIINKPIRMEGLSFERKTN